ncbi:hypothetical protein [Rubrobacter indicoceani]|uniref:hypothetical protein n=1 Tax=Rubrobacter indicoceani TaxID=2051957 RepID=UPI000E5C1D07|nr:hypothetical protein [Rubrobacter indicoceani]
MGGAEVAIIMALGTAVAGLAGILSRSWTAQIRRLQAENRALKKVIVSNQEAMEAYLKVAAEEGAKWDE